MIYSCCVPMTCAPPYILVGCLDEFAFRQQSLSKPYLRLACCYALLFESFNTIDLKTNMTGILDELSSCDQCDDCVFMRVRQARNALRSQRCGFIAVATVRWHWKPAYRSSVKNRCTYTFTAQDENWTLDAELIQIQ